MLHVISATFNNPWKIALMSWPWQMVADKAVKGPDSMALLRHILNRDGISSNKGGTNKVKVDNSNTAERG